MNEEFLCVAKIIAPHGIKGEVKILSFTENIDDIFSFSEIFDNSGKIYKITKRHISNGKIIAKIDGIYDRNNSELLTGTELFVNKSQLPETSEDQYYCADLIGLNIENNNGEIIGIVKHIHNFGAGDIIEIEFNDQNHNNMFLFNKINFPEIDVNAKKIVFNQMQK